MATNTNTTFANIDWSDSALDSDEGLDPRVLDFKKMMVQSLSADLEIGAAGGTLANNSIVNLIALNAVMLTYYTNRPQTAWEHIWVGEFARIYDQRLAIVQSLGIVENENESRLKTAKFFINWKLRGVRGRFSPDPPAPSNDEGTTSGAS